MFGARINGPTWRHRHRGVTESSVSGEGAISICEGGKEMDEEDKAF